jgi:hypothetical protein
MQKVNFEAERYMIRVTTCSCGSTRREKQTSFGFARTTVSCSRRVKEGTVDRKLRGNEGERARENLLSQGSSGK